MALAPEVKGQRYRCAETRPITAPAIGRCRRPTKIRTAGLAANEVIPDLTDAVARTAWIRLEAAKRRLMHTLIALRLPIEARTERPAGGLAFSFMQESPGCAPVFTGHSDGLRTISVAEADDPFREKMREQMGEAYRTVVGHFRHEVGHYYWVADPRPKSYRVSRAVRYEQAYRAACSGY